MSARRSRFAVVRPRPQPVSAKFPPVVIVASIVDGARSTKETVSLGPDPKMPVLKTSIPGRLPGAKYVIPCWAATRRVVLSALSNDVVSVPLTTVIASPQSTDAARSGSLGRRRERLSPGGQLKTERPRFRGLCPTGAAGLE